MTKTLRDLVWLSFFGLVLLAWWMMYAMSRDMGLDLLGRPDAMGEAMRQMDPRMPMDMPMARFGPLFGMWAAMMAAMMLPTMVPALRAYEDLMRSADGTLGGWLGLLAGYMTVWIAFAAAITGVQLALLFSGVIDMLGISRTWAFQGGLLIVVGAFQFTRLKEVCHGVCHAPMTYYLGHWRPGTLGGLRMGLGLGAFCAVCCWGFMALGFVGGVMSLAWMGLATLFMVLEKLPQIGRRVTRPGGAILIAAGLVVLVWPLVMTGD